MHFNPRVGVATTCAKTYYRYSSCLKSLKLPFDSIFPEEMSDYLGDLILTTSHEISESCSRPILCEEILDTSPTVVLGLIIQKLCSDYGEENLVLGIDPGNRIGLSVYYFENEIESSFYLSLDKLIFHIVHLFEKLRAKRKIVKIGNGNPLIANQIVKSLYLNFCSPFEFEIVDEHKTSLKTKHFNQRGKRDMLSAKNILQRDGFRHFVFPLSTNEFH